MSPPVNLRSTGAAGVGARIVGTLFFLFFLGMGLGFVWLVGREALAGLKTWTWTRTPCDILRSEVRDVDSRNRKSGDFYFEVEYRYSHRGQTYNCTQDRLRPASFSDYSKAAHLAQTYAPGAHAVCYVNPSDPSQAVLERGSLLFPLVIFFPMIFVAIGLGGIFATWRNASSKPAPVRPISDLSTKAVSQRFAVVFFAAFIILGGILFYVISVRSFSEMLSAKEWPAVSCTIISSDIKSHRAEHGHTYSINILYTYIFNDREYKANRYDFMGGSSSGLAGKQSILSRYPPGSTRLCYVNPHDPTQAVLERGFTPMMWLGMLPLLFCLLGLVGLASTIRKRRQQTSSDKPITDYDRESLTGSSFGWSSANDRTKSLLLQPSTSPWARLLITIIFALFWNGIISIFVAQAIKGWRSSPFEWFLALFLIPFVLVGLGLLVAIGYFFLSLFNPRPCLTVNPAAPRLGDSLRVDWEIGGRVESLQNLNVVLEGREEATYNNGKNTSTDHSVFARFDIARCTLPQEMRSGNGSVTIPADLMHSFASQHNKIRWLIRVEGSIARWPDLNEEFALSVLPCSAKTTEDL